MLHNMKNNIRLENRENKMQLLNLESVPTRHLLYFSFYMFSKHQAVSTTNAFCETKTPV